MHRFETESATSRSPRHRDRLLRIPKLVDADTAASVRDSLADARLDAGTSTLPGAGAGEAPTAGATPTAVAPAIDLPAAEGRHRQQHGAHRLAVSAADAEAESLETTSPNVGDDSAEETRPSIWTRLTSISGRTIGRVLVLLAVIVAAFALASLFAGGTDDSVSGAAQDEFDVQEITSATDGPLRAPAPRANNESRSVDELFNVSPDLRVNVGAAATAAAGSNARQSAANPEPTRRRVAGASNARSEGTNVARTQQRRETRRPQVERPRGTVARPLAEPGQEAPAVARNRQRTSNRSVGRETRQDVARSLPSTPPARRRAANSNESNYSYDSTDPSNFREPAYDIPAVANRPGQRLQ